MDIFVTSHRSGLYTVDYSSMITSIAGSSTLSGAVLLKRVKFANNKWLVDHKHVSVWPANIWAANLALTGGEPWRWYKLSQAEVEARLNAGETVDDIRGFNMRLERWQRYENYWERADGWRILLQDGNWVPDHTNCNADRDFTLKDSPHHFEPIIYSSQDAEDVMGLVDKMRPWDTGSNKYEFQE